MYSAGLVRDLHYTSKNDKTMIDHEHVWEHCPHCDEEVMLDAELKVQTCPNCGKRIVACAMCLACDASDKNYCATCCLCYQAERENEELEEDRKWRTKMKAKMEENRETDY